MDVYWYWPFLRPEELVLAEGFARSGDRLVVHTTRRDADPLARTAGGYQLLPTLPNATPHSEQHARWATSRAVTYAARAATRERALRADRFDVAHVVYLNYFTDGPALARLGRHVPLVSTVHDVVPHLSRIPRSVERRLLASQYRHAGTILVHHEAVRRRLLGEFPIDPARVHVEPLPIPVVPPKAPRRAGETPLTVLFFGTLRRNKGVNVLLDSIERLRGETDARFVIAGRGFDDVEATVSSAAARDRRVVAELRYVTASHKEELYEGADLVVLPYTSFASQSAVLRDAYAHRVPLVVSDVGALGATIRAERTGWVVPPADADALAQTLLTALRDEPARAAAAAAAGEIARDRTPETVGARLRALYEKVVSDAGR